MTVRRSRTTNTLVLGLALLYPTPSLAREPDSEQLKHAEGSATPPELRGDTHVKYPDDATGNEVVVLSLLVSATGNVAEVQVVEGREPFGSTARRAAQEWVFTPAQVDGTARAARILFRVEFLAPDEPEPSLAQVPSPVDTETTNAPSTDEQELVVSVEGIRRPGVARVLSDAETTIIPGAEGDPVRAIEAMPGTVPILGSGPFIGLRGSSPGMVGYVYDGIAIPYLFHLARGTAVVHPWLVDSASIHGAGAPARLGRSGGGFLEAHPAKPEGHARAGARLRFTDAAVGAEAPYGNGTGNVLLAGRYSYTRPMVSLIAPEFSLNYWDYQGRVHHEIQPQHRVELLTFGAGDRSAQEEPDGTTRDLFRGSFHRVAIRYQYLKSDGGHDRLGVVLGHDRWDGRPSPIRPHSSSAHLVYDGSGAYSDDVWVEYGVDVGVRRQTEFYFASEDIAATYDRNDVETGSFVDITYQATARTVMAFGVRVDLFGSESSPRTREATALAPQPRFSLSHQVNDTVRIHQAFGLAAQARSPAQRPPGRTYSVEGGLERVASSDFGIETRWPGNVVFDVTTFHNGYFRVGDVETLLFVEDQNYDRTRGYGQSAGLEVSLRRTWGARLRGFLSYTLSRSWRALGRVRTEAEFDRPHVVDGALAYDLGLGWSLSTRGTFYSGYPARVASAEQFATRPRTTPFYQVDWQLAKRWELGARGAWWGLTMGVLNTTLNSETNDMYCTATTCQEEPVGPATIPTFGVEGEL